MRPDPPLTVLVVDDQESNRDLVRRQLGERYRILSAVSGPKALELLETETVDLVILDVMMPGMSGFDVCKEIKSREEDGFLPVLLLTALNQQDDRNRGLRAGADEFLSKPVNGSELRLRVEAFLRLREQDRTIRTQFADLGRLQALKDDLVSLIVHDLRNPLMGTQGYLQVLDRKISDSGQVEHGALVRKALASAAKMRDLLDGVLEVRRLEEGGLSVRPEESRVGGLVGEAVATVEGAGRIRGVRFDLSVVGDPTARIDRKLSRRAVENLLANALKYSPAGSIVDVTVATSNEGIRIRVEDRGPGVPDGLKHRLFEKYGSAEGTSNRRRSGFGLGLYLVKLVMDAHGGSTAVEDRDGGGSVFDLVFPCPEPERDSSGAPRVVESVRAGR